MKIRPFSESDYGPVADVKTAAMPHWAVSADQLRYWDLHFDPESTTHRWVVEMDGVVVAFGSFTVGLNTSGAGELVLGGAVHPLYRNNGIGRALFQHVLQQALGLSPTQLTVLHVPEEPPDSTEFMRHRGFLRERESWVSELDLDSLHWDPSLDPIAILAQTDCAPYTLAELATDPMFGQRLLALYLEVSADLSTTISSCQASFNSFLRELLGYPVPNPRLLKEGQFIAVGTDGTYAGITLFWASPIAGRLDVGLTGVARAYRGRGIARALKLLAIKRGHELGARTMTTVNASSNGQILRLNAQLGFRRRAAYVDFVRRIAP